jgi:hypothetical protein
MNKPLFKRVILQIEKSNLSDDPFSEKTEEVVRLIDCANDCIDEIKENLGHKVIFNGDILKKISQDEKQLTVITHETNILKWDN